MRPLVTSALHTAAALATVALTTEAFTRDAQLRLIASTFLAALLENYLHRHPDARPGIWPLLVAISSAHTPTWRAPSVACSHAHSGWNLSWPLTTTHDHSRPLMQASPLPLTTTHDHSCRPRRSLSRPLTTTHDHSCRPRRSWRAAALVVAASAAFWAGVLYGFLLRADVTVTIDGAASTIKASQLIACSACALRPDRMLHMLRTLTEHSCVKRRLEAALKRLGGGGMTSVADAPRVVARYSDCSHLDYILELITTAKSETPPLVQFLRDECGLGRSR